MAPSRLPMWGLPVGLMPVRTRGGTRFLTTSVFRATRGAGAARYVAMRTLTTTLLLATLSLAGCSKDYPQCETYVDLAMKCDADIKSAPSGDKKSAKLVLGGMCEAAFKNDTDSVEGETRRMVTEMYAEIRTRANCVAKANTCAQYDVCTE